MSPSSSQPDITLYFLNSSRAIRIAFLLSSLQLPYKLISANRAANGLAPPSFRSTIPAPLRKSPTLKDGALILQESSAITEYLCETYDVEHRLMPADATERARVREWVAAAEGTFLMHGIAIMYARARLPSTVPPGTWKEMNAAMSPNMHNALNWLDNHLRGIHAEGGRYLVANRLTVADINMLFSIQLIYDRKLGLEDTEVRWEHVERWRSEMEEEESWVRCVKKTGFTLGGTL